MKKHILGFLRRGLIACGFGPLVLAAVYLALHRHGALQTLTVNQVCRGVFSMAALAFVAGGLNILYQMERLPLMFAMLIHGGVLYLCYLATYLFNGWLEEGALPILVFSVIFVVGYLVIWAVISTLVRKNTKKVNAVLKKKQQEL